jgi:hypothetical protein
VDLLDKRVAAVSAEVARAKTLWPVALRSLEARLEDVTSTRHHAGESADEGVSSPDEAGAADDLLAGLRNSLQAMESVAAEMERASEPEATVPAPPAPAAADVTDPAPTQQAVAGGARIVPLRASDP